MNDSAAESGADGPGAGSGPSAPVFGPETSPPPGETAIKATDEVVAQSAQRRSKVQAGITLAALGVVFGDIGTSPLYGLQTVFSIDNHAVRPTPDDVYGVISMVFWSVTLIVSIKYVTIVMRADNDGEGGVMALAALARRAFGVGSQRTVKVLLMAIIGASLFYGDSVITPAISVLSAVEGVTVVQPSLDDWVLPIAITILTCLFAGQRFGTHKVGALFGPVMLLWFACLALSGLHEVILQPGVIRGISPTYAVSFITNHPKTTFIAMGAIVLCITGAEALYADMGHFGRPPIRRAWFFIVFPALTLQYLGQGGLILHTPEAVSNPFFLLLPGWARLPMVVLATAATVIASQAVISGAFSVSRQASQLGLLPTLTVRQTSDASAGQVYLPVINAVLFVGVLVLMLLFRTSARLATAYGVSVTGALLIDTILLLFVARGRWHWATWKLVLFAVVFGGIEFTFFSANLTKIAHGGWLPLLIATLVFTVMTTWRRGRDIVTDNRISSEGPLMEFIDEMKAQHVLRIPGTAVFPHPSKETTPLALRANVTHNGVLHRTVIIFSAEPRNVPHIDPSDQVTIDHLGSETDGIVHVTMRYGFFDAPNIPEVLARTSRPGVAEFDLDPSQTSYFVSRASLSVTRAPGMSRWRKKLFITLARNAANPVGFFDLPEDQTVIMGSQVEV
ncbi:KUP system potassium uptake protein [Frankineae bacterium MT45]|nr:KUP system potassium uptake protein [Frankineae bacterium MT45]